MAYEKTQTRGMKVNWGERAASVKLHKVLHAPGEFFYGHSEVLADLRPVIKSVTTKKTPSFLIYKARPGCGGMVCCI